MSRNRNVNSIVNGGPAVELVSAVERFVYRRPSHENERYHFEELYEEDFLNYCLESKDISTNTSLHKVLLYLANIEFSLYVYDDTDWIIDYTDFQDYAIYMFDYMYGDVPSEFLSNSEEAVMQAKDTYKEKFHYGLNFIVDSAFAQLWVRKAFLFDFNMLCAERISQLRKSDYPVLSQNGRLPRAKSFPKWLKDLLIKREAGCCYYCFKPVVTTNLINKTHDVDHVVPIAKGGSNDPTNLAISCSSCNSQKKANIVQVSDTFAWPKRDII